MVNFRETADTRQINNNLLNAITPFGGIEFFRNKMMLGENYVKIYGITKYPSTLSRGWAAKIAGLPNVITTQIFEPANNADLLGDLSKSVAKYRGLAMSTKDELERQRAEKKADDAEILMKQIDQNGEIIGYMSNIIMVVAKDEAQLEKSCRGLESAIATLNCKARNLTNMYKDAFKSISPYNMPADDILNVLRRNVPKSSFIEGFPFASNSFVDQTGYPFGRNSKGGLVVLDPWVRGGDRTNSNFVVLGVPGVGKSTTVKHLMTSEYMMGTVCIVIDPEREYKDLTRKLEGDWVNAGGGAFIINPLQFKIVPLDEDDEEEEGVVGVGLGVGLGVGGDKSQIDKLYSNEEMRGNSLANPSMSLHFKTLEVFFKLYVPDITTRQMSLLKLLLEKLYGDFGISWDTDPSGLKNTDYPILTDLYDLIIKARDEGSVMGQSLEIFKDDISELEIILREMSKGADSFIWNGHSSIDPKGDFICLDTHNLQDTSENVKRAQYYNLLTWTWQRMSRDRKEKVMLFADEAYLMVDPAVPQSLIYMRNVAKRARKYEAGLCVIFHSVVDVLDPSIKMYGQALLDTPAYKILMGTDGVNLAEASKIYNLTLSEEELLASKQRGVSLFIAGSRRFKVEHEISEYELALMGRGGGR